MSAFVIQVGILLITMGRVFATLRLDSSYNQMNVYVMSERFGENCLKIITTSGN